MSTSKLSVESLQRGLSVIAVRKTGAGTPVLSGLCASFCTIVDNGVGDFTIVVNVPRPFAQSVIATATAHSSGIIRLNVATSSKLQISVRCFAVDGITAAELDFDLICLGSYASDLG